MPCGIMRDISRFKRFLSLETGRGQKCKETSSRFSLFQSHTGPAERNLKTQTIRQLKYIDLSETANIIGLLSHSRVCAAVIVIVGIRQEMGSDAPTLASLAVKHRGPKKCCVASVATISLIGQRALSLSLNLSGDVGKSVRKSQADSAFFKVTRDQQKEIWRHKPSGN